MADKEATVYIIDMGMSMSEKHNGRNVSDLDWAMTYVWEKITSTVATDRKTAQLGVIGLRTDRMTPRPKWRLRLFILGQARRMS